jgi:hypothetical protein
VCCAIPPGFKSSGGFRLMLLKCFGVLFGREQSICQEIKTFFAVAQRASGAYELYKISFC